MAKFLWITIFCMSCSALAFDVKTEAQEPEWLARLFFVNGKSLVKSRSFFLSSEGQTNPVKELEASLELIRKRDFDFACTFPGRYSYLAKRLGITETFFCDGFLSWRDSFEADSLSVMFASQYLENPASSFGHTYLKINSEKKSLYLNKVISFAATVPEKIGGWDYIWNGLTGGFDGVFNDAPFYILFQEYANMEKRDIWEYQLTTSKEKTLELLAILYEVIHLAKFEYKFLSENCSSLLLRLIDILESKSLNQNLPFYVIPIETVKVLEREEMIKKSIYHPSITSRMSLQAEDMKSLEIKEFNDYLHRNKSLLPSTTARTLDLSLEYLNFLRQKNAGVLDPSRKEDFNKFLLLRSQYPEKPSEPERKILNPMDASGPRRLSLGLQGDDKASKNLALTFRPVGKDFFDKPNGYAKESEINVLKTKVLFDDKIPNNSSVTVDILGLRKYSDFNQITKDFSWGTNLALKNKQKNYFTEVDSHLGLGKNVFKSFLSYVVIHPTFRFGNLSHRLNFLPQIEAGIIKSSEKFVLKASGFSGLVYDGYRKRYFRELRSSASWILNKSTSLNLSHEFSYLGESQNSLEAGLSFYF